MDENKNSVLIVDDESLNITALSHILSQEYTIYVEKDGEGCLESAKELKPDLILLDIIMPEMTGFEVIRLLKEDDETRDIPVVFVTGLSTPKDEEHSFTLGAADYISKPFSAPIVKLRVKNQLQIAEQMRKIKKYSASDPLTGVATRMHFNAVLKQEWQHAMRNKSTLSLILVNINNFAKVNEVYGFSGGDIVLKETAQIISRKLAGINCQIARFDGAEFAILLPYSDKANIEHISADILNALNNHHFTLPDASANISVRVGINTVSPVSITSQILDSFILDTAKKVEKEAFA